MNSMRGCRVWLAVGIAFLTISVGAAQEGGFDRPNVVVEQAASGILSAMDGRREELTADRGALFALVEEQFLPHFDRAYAAFLVLGKHGRKASKDQRRRFTDALYNYVLSQYANGLLEFTSDRMKVLPFRGDAEAKRTTVKTEVYLDDGTGVPVNYSLRRTDNGWKVYDVTIEGISYVKNFRTQLGSEIQQKGLDAVIERLEGEAQTTTAASS